MWGCPNPTFDKNFVLHLIQEANPMDTNLPLGPLLHYPTFPQSYMHPSSAVQGELHANETTVYLVRPKAMPITTHTYFRPLSYSVYR